MIVLLLIAQILFGRSERSHAGPDGAGLLYVGTFSERGSEGIYVFEADLPGGMARKLQAVGGMQSPSFLALHPGGRFLYSANRNSVVEGKDWGSLSAFAVDPQSGLLTPLNERPSYGAGACYVSTDNPGSVLFVANYTGGSLAAFPLGAGGGIGEVLKVEQYEGRSVHPERQDASHAHACVPSPDNRFLYVTDLGADLIRAYRINPGRGELEEARSGSTKTQPGSGPRHFAFHPDGRFAFLAEELSSSVSAYRYRAGDGHLELLDRRSTLPEDFAGENTVADIRVHPNGRFLYVSNRGHDSLALFGIDPERGVLSPLGYEPTLGKRPRNFIIHPSGEYLLVANRDSDNIVVFKLDGSTGKLTFSGQEISVPAPVCLLWR